MARHHGGGGLGVVDSGSRVQVTGVTNRADNSCVWATFIELEDETRAGKCHRVAGSVRPE